MMSNETAIIPIQQQPVNDANNELAEVEYDEDIQVLQALTEGGLRDYMSSQPDLNAKVIAILIDWLVKVHLKFELIPVSLYLTINIVDRYLFVKNVPRRELQLVGISANAHGLQIRGNLAARSQ